MIERREEDEEGSLDDRWSVTYGEIARQTNLDKRSVRLAIGKLEAGRAPLIERDRPSGEDPSWVFSLSAINMQTF